jgi:site-specific DNA-methyltransferase (adenine-specific)
MTQPYSLHTGDCLDVLKTLDAESIDAIVTDPPYGLAFMGKKWDCDAPSTDIWQECLRVLKPGGHLLAFAGTRTQHRMACRIEDAGFEIRDMIAWVYGSGFPKSHNLKDEWQGWGTALKPALEPITMARKPLTGTVAENVLTYGTGGLNIDASRVPGELEGDPNRFANTNGGNFNTSLALENHKPPVVRSEGRWPANLIHDGSDEVVRLFPVTTSGGGDKRQKKASTFNACVAGRELHISTGIGNDTGSAARFFYCAKASKAEREAGLEGMESIHRVNGNKWTDQDYRVTNGERPPTAESGPRTNHHPTVKPIDLMAYLCRLITPPSGTILDPFMGSGSTGVAALREGFKFIGIELNAEYAEIAQKRIENELNKAPLFTNA